MEPSFFIDPLSRIEFSLDDIDAIGQICIQCVVLAGGYLSSLIYSFSKLVFR